MPKDPISNNDALRRNGSIPKITPEALHAAGKSEALKGSSEFQASQNKPPLQLADAPIKGLPQLQQSLLAEHPTLEAPALQQMQRVTQKSKVQGTENQATATAPAPSSEDPSVDPMPVRFGSSQINPTFVSSIVLFLSASIAKETQDTGLESIQSNTNQTLVANKKQIDSMNDSLDSANKRDKGNKWSQRLSWMGAAVGALMVVATVASGGILAAIPVALAAAVGIGLAIGSQHGSPVTSWVSKEASKVAEVGLNLISDIGHVLSGGKWEMDPDKEDKIAQAIGQVVTAVLIIAVEVGLVAASGKMVRTGTGTHMLKMIGKSAKKASVVVGGIMKIGQGASGITSSAYNYESQNAQAAASAYKSMATFLGNISTQLNKFVQDLIKTSTELDKTIETILKAQSDTVANAARVI